MNFGDCPYDDCSGLLWQPIPDDTSLPAWAKIQCETCGRDVWYLYSRVDPQAWTVEDFMAEHEIDEAAMTIKPRQAP